MNDNLVTSVNVKKLICYLHLLVSEKSFFSNGVTLFISATSGHASCSEVADQQIMLSFIVLFYFVMVWQPFMGELFFFVFVLGILLFIVLIFVF